MGISQYPIPVERVAEHLGAALRFEPFDGDISGMLFRDDQRVIIGVNSLDGVTRQRFTISHEIGHLMLHNGRPMFVEKHVQVNLRDSVSSTATNREEIEANRFAAELLMPAGMVKHEASRRLGKVPQCRGTRCLTVWQRHSKSAGKRWKSASPISVCCFRREIVGLGGFGRTKNSDQPQSPSKKPHLHFF